jgi:hypothetical protein
MKRKEGKKEDCVKEGRYDIKGGREEGRKEEKKLERKNNLKEGGYKG